MFDAFHAKLPDTYVVVVSGILMSESSQYDSIVKKVNQYLREYCVEKSYMYFVYAEDMTAMAIDYNEYKYGNRMVGTSNAAAGFGGKIGSGLGASIVGWCPGIAGYDAAAETATSAVRQAIYTFGIYILLYFLSQCLLLHIVLTLRQSFLP